MTHLLFLLRGHSGPGPQFLPSFYFVPSLLALPTLTFELEVVSAHFNF